MLETVVSLLKLPHFCFVLISALACIVNRDNQSSTRMEVTEEEEMKGNLLSA